jgi:hypothetical protein
MQSAQSEERNVVFNDDGIERVVFTLPPTNRPDLPSVTAFALHKAGSVLLNNILQDLSREIDLTYVSIADEFFRIGLPWQKAPKCTSDIFLAAGYCYGGFRVWPSTFEIPIIATSRSVLLVRDPRDRLVSLYYSLKESHPEPGDKLASTKIDFIAKRRLARSLDIDKFVRHRAAEFISRLSIYRTELCEKYPAKIYRYEDVIYDKENWVADLVGHFGWSVPSKAICSIAAQHNVIPTSEDKSKHIRQVHPGNFRKHLKPETITYLNDVFAEEMAYLGYDLR